MKRVAQQRTFRFSPDMTSRLVWKVRLFAWGSVVIIFLVVDCNGERNNVCRCASQSSRSSRMVSWKNIIEASASSGAKSHSTEIFEFGSVASLHSSSSRSIIPKEVSWCCFWCRTGQDSLFRTSKNHLVAPEVVAIPHLISESSGAPFAS